MGYIFAALAPILLLIVPGDTRRAELRWHERPVQASADCTLYASPTGDAEASGVSADEPTTLDEARHHTMPGSVVCLLPGTYAVTTPFEITRSGTPDSWIAYRSLEAADPALIVPGRGSWDLIQVHGAAYIEIADLRFDGKGHASNAVGCKGGHHLRVLRNDIRHMGQAGIATYRDAAGGRCDYVTADRNLIYRSGYLQGWSSGISFNHHFWYDEYAGFHSFITNNVIAGQVDNSGRHTDGNGIALDRGDTPPVLVANNVVYNNGGRCIHTLYARNAWIVNNTCYKNALDLRVASANIGNNGEFVFYGSTGNVVINNIAYAWRAGRPFSDEAGEPATFYRNIWHGPDPWANWVSSAALDDPDRLLGADPLFVDPPPVDEAADGQYALAIAPAEIGGRFYLRTGSPAIGTGVDPAMVPEITPELQAGLDVYVYSDVEGRERPRGGRWNLGAYQNTGT
jgi:hypothetical protein